MNSFYHPRERGQEDHEQSGQYGGLNDAHAQEGHGASESYAGDTGHAEHEGHAEYATHNVNQANETTQGTAAEPPAQNAALSDKDLGVYQVLLAVERGELSPEDAARKLEELEASGPGDANPGPI